MFLKKKLNNKLVVTKRNLNKKNLSQNKNKIKYKFYFKT